MIDKLYPPSITGTLPSFYKTEKGTTIVVPFSMNKTVSPKEVKGFKLRLKTASTDILYGTLDSDEGSWNKNEKIEPTVSFTLTDTILKKLSIGYYYKVQIAYVDQSDIIGFYSTVAIVKYTSKPTVEINGYDLDKINPYMTTYIGEYSNKDTTEKVYQYKFDLYDNQDNLLETSKWQLHNSYEDSSLTSSIDHYNMKYAPNKNVTYKIQYSVKTNNNAIFSSQKYLVMESNTIEPEISAQLVAHLNYDNACIDLKFTNSTKAITGSFLLTRASSEDDFSSWLQIADLSLIGELPSKFLFKDFAIEQGITYVYSLQQYNDYKVYSNRLLSNYLVAGFEDAYLYDGKKQLRIRFNSNISSFKTVLQESKKTTLGGKYPIITRNGMTEYKEFPITGLISYYMDNDEFFFSIQNDLNIANWVPTTDIIDDNLYIERKFKMAVLEWLNNGEPKLFKSPQEGNYIVRLMNVNLTPVAQTTRMLHNFSCTAVEIADLNFDNLIKFNLIKAEKVVTYQTRWETVVLNDLWTEIDRNNKTKPDNEKINIYDIDLLDGNEAYSIDFRDMRFGQQFSFLINNKGVAPNTPYTIMIGVTGSYSLQVDSPITQLKLVAPRTNTGNDTLFENSTYYFQNIPLQGSVTFSIKSTSQNKFDYIINLRQRDIPIHQVFGPDENILSYFNNFRRTISRIYYARFSALEIVPVYSKLFGLPITDRYGNITSYFNGSKQTLKNADDGNDLNNTAQVYSISKINNNNEKDITYYRYYNGKLYEQQHMETVFKYLGELDPFTLYSDTRNNKTYYYRLYNDELVDVTDWVIQNNIHKDTSYQILYKDLSPYVIYEKHNITKDKKTNKEILIKEYFKYNGYELKPLTEYSTIVEYGTQTTIDVKEKQTIYIPEVDTIPEYIKIGSGVCVEIGMQIRDITYKVEDLTLIKEKKAEYDQALMEYNMFALQLKKLDDSLKQITSWEEAQTKVPSVLFIWDENIFSAIPTTSIEMENIWTRFVNKKINLYVKNENNYTQKDIDNKFNKLREIEEGTEDKKGLITLIQEEIKRQKEVRGDDE